MTAVLHYEVQRFFLFVCREETNLPKSAGRGGKNTGCLPLRHKDGKNTNESQKPA
jgi:hypothetical protein